MALVDRERGFVFIHVYKTGGTSIRNFLSRSSTEEILSIHATARLVQKREDSWSTLFSFGFVRNPFDWLASLWFQHKTHPPVELPAGARVPEFSFDDEYLMWLIASLDWPKTDDGFGRHWRLVDFLCDHNHDPIVDFVGRYERLDEDFAHICKEIGIPVGPLPVANVLKGDLDYRALYTSHSIELVERAFAADLKTFDYSFDA